MKAWIGWALLIAAGSAFALAREDCDGPASVVLQAAAPIDARAHWLGRARLQWPGADAAGSYRLHHARDGTIVARAGEPVRGADGALALRADAAPPGARFEFVGAGARLALPPLPRARIAALHRAQLVLVREDAAGRVLDATALQAAGALDDLYAAARHTRAPLGATPGARATTFRVWAPTAQAVALCLDGAAQPMRRDARTGIWLASRPGNLQGQRYTFVVDVFARGSGRVRNRVTDPYALALDADSRHAVVADLRAARWAPRGWHATPRPRPLAHATDLAIYELHVRDFSLRDPLVPPADRGKYLGFTHAGSHGMRHLKTLAQAGLTDVHLLPVFDLASIPERGCTSPTLPADAAPDSDAQQAAAMHDAANDCFNWGYDPWHFSAPEGSYASDANDPAGRVREFRAMVQALHRAGLRVGMDMVYNHTSASGQHAQSVLDRIVPGYYHRLDATGSVERSTCCDNTATEHAMMERLMIDSAVVWARDHRIDSMRFDLMGHQPRAAMQRLQRAVDRAAGRRIHLIGEGWNFGEVKDGARFVQAAQGRLAGTGIATFSDRARDGARGRDGRPGWLHGGGGAAAAALVRVGLAGTLQRGEAVDYNGQPAGYASQPGEVVNYVENHDNPTLFDHNALTLGAAATRDDLVRLQTLGNALVLFSQGVAYVHAGQELLRSKSLDRNSYDSGDGFNRLDYTLADNGFGVGLPPARDNAEHWPAMRPLLARAAELRPTPAQIAATRDAFVELLRIRASSSLWRLRTAAEVERRLTLFNARPNLIAGHLNGAGLAGANFREIVYLLNADAAEQTVTLDALRGRAFVPHPAQRNPAARYDRARGAFSVPARSAAVFVRPATPATPAR